MKLILPILASKNNSFPSIIKGAFKTWGSLNIPNIKVFAYFGGYSKEEMIDNELHLSEDDTNLLTKTIKAFEFCLKNFEFDYLIRPNASTFVRLDALYKYLEDKPRKNYYAGHEIIINLKPNEELYFKTKQVKYPSGTAMMYSRDMIENIVSNKNEIKYSGYGDDFDIGLYFQRSDVLMTEKVPHIPFVDYNLDFLKNTPKSILEKYIFFRCKTEQLNFTNLTQNFLLMNPRFRNDTEKMEYLYNIFYK
jgi:hypothetical protein